MKVALAAMAFTFAANASLAACGSDPEACSIDQGTYHAVLPEGDIKGSVIFLHGGGGSGKGSISNKRWVPAMLENGFAVITPDGKVRPGRNSDFKLYSSTDGTNWQLEASGTSSGETLELEALAPTQYAIIQARYIRIEGQGNSSNTWNSITEVEFVGQLVN